MKKIPLVRTYLPPKEVLLPSLEKVLYSGYIAQGEEVEKFEKLFGDYLGNKNVVSVNSGTAALHIALMLAGVGPGDEVISTALTAEPTNVAIKMTGAKIVWGDVDPKTGCLDPNDVESKINENTKAIVVVDYAGVPVHIKRFKEIEKKYNIKIIQDAAHALGAKYNDVKIGNHFDFVCFSFQAIKHMTTVDGGMLALSNKEIREKAKLLRWFGLDKKKSRDKNRIYIQGYKYHMNNVIATIGIAQLSYIDKIIKKYIENGKFYDVQLRDVYGVELLDYYKDSVPSYWLYTLKVENKAGFKRKLQEMGIVASELHLRNDLHPIFQESKNYLPNLDEFYSKYIHIPCGWWVGEEEREYIVNVIKKGW